MIKCSSCGVPKQECVEEGSVYNGKFLAPGRYLAAWLCQVCVEETNVRCSHCDEVFPEHKPLPNPLDDQPFLCKECDIKLLEELDDFTNDQ